MPPKRPDDRAAQHLGAAYGHADTNLLISVLTEGLALAISDQEKARLRAIIRDLEHANTNRHRWLSVRHTALD